jgi:N-glycosylase/DNA lyase
MRRDRGGEAQGSSRPPLQDEMSVLNVTDFSLELTLGCGQVFHWKKEGSGYLGAIANQAIFVEQRGEKLLVPPGTKATVAEYFALDHPLSEIYATFPPDDAMRAALAFCHGLRLIRQPLWECVATFITSSMKQVAHIAQISHTMRARFGERCEWNGQSLFAYPSPERIAALNEADLLACSLGYRAKNLLASARMIASGEVNLERIVEMPDEAALEELCRLPGVGEKVANCALLFAFGRPKAFPIDVWIERVLREIYFRGKRRVTGKRLRDFSATYFGPYSGYAQQYLFHHARLTWPKRQSLASPKRKHSRTPVKRPPAAPAKALQAC